MTLEEKIKEYNEENEIIIELINSMKKIHHMERIFIIQLFEMEFLIILVDENSLDKENIES